MKFTSEETVEHLTNLMWKMRDVEGQIGFDIDAPPDDESFEYKYVYGVECEEFEVLVEELIVDLQSAQAIFKSRKKHGVLV